MVTTGAAEKSIARRLPEKKGARRMRDNLDFNDLVAGIATMMLVIITSAALLAAF
jgi:hypothetical protein